MGVITVLLLHKRSQTADLLRTPLHNIVDHLGNEGRPKEVLPYAEGPA